jgi:hypothetical protein
LIANSGIQVIRLGNLFFVAWSWGLCFSTKGFEMASINDGGRDVLKALGDAALDASGLGFASPIWDLFFPAGEPVFSPAQLQQMKTLFQELLDQQYFQSALDLFVAATRNLNNYANNPIQSDLSVVIGQISEACSIINSDGNYLCYERAKLYIAASSLWTLALKFEAEASPGSGAEKNIATSAMRTINALMLYEQAYGAALGWPEYIAFKRATLFNEGQLSGSAIRAFGADYCTKIQSMLKLVREHDPEGLQLAPKPAYYLCVTPFNSHSTVDFWDEVNCSHFSYPDSWPAHPMEYMCFFKSSPLGGGYYPLGDLASYESQAATGRLPEALKQTVYIKSGAAQLYLADAYSEVFHDRDSGNPAYYSKWNAVGPGGVGVQIGSFVGPSTAWAQPTGPCMLVDPAFTMEVEIANELWDNGSSEGPSEEDCIIYKHPQFGIYGVYDLWRSHSRPSPDKTIGLSYAAISGVADIDPLFLANDSRTLSLLRG